MTAKLPSSTIIYSTLLLPFVLHLAENANAFHTSAFVPRSASRPPFAMMSAATPVAPTFSGTIAESSDLYTALRKPSKTLSVILEIEMPLGGVSDDAERKISVADIASRSMQLRKLKASALATNDVQVAAELVKEQATAQGNFPGPAPVIYTGDDVAGAVQAGVSAVVVSASSSATASALGIPKIYRISSMEEAAAVSNGNAFFVTGSDEDEVTTVGELVAALPATSIVLAAVNSMQTNQAEMALAKSLQSVGVTAILARQAIVGDNEDLEYADFVVSGLTKKKSSTFNMSGLTGKANGHFGGVASTASKTWLRMKRKHAASSSPKDAVVQSEQ